MTRQVGQKTTRLLEAPFGKRGPPSVPNAGDEGDDPYASATLVETTWPRVHTATVSTESPRCCHRARRGHGTASLRVLSVRISWCRRARLRKPRLADQAHRPAAIGRPEAGDVRFL